MDAMSTTHVVRRGKFGAGGPSHSLARSTLVFVFVWVVSRIVIIICSLVLQVSIRVHRTHNSAIYKYT